ncbi:MAG: DUF4337 domain-containing protein [Bacteroidota bacterium]|nr:DUF4337 domain-containing protein [Bacteroidota bacterium]
MAEETNEKWTNYLAMTTIIIAVCATLSTFKGGGYSTRSLMNQTLASDQWAFFDSKGVKSYVFEAQLDNIIFQKSMLDASGKGSKVQNQYQQQIDSLNQKIRRFSDEKKVIRKKAEEFVKISDESKLHANAFGIAVIFLQVSILLSSISALTKRKYIWIISLFVGACGILYFLNGFFLFM